MGSINVKSLENFLTLELKEYAHVRFTQTKRPHSVQHWQIFLEYMRKFHELTYTAKDNKKSWLERDSNSHLRVIGPPLTRFETLHTLTDIQC